MDAANDRLGEISDNSDDIYNNFDEARGKRLFSSLQLHPDLHMHLSRRFWESVCAKLSYIDESQHQSLLALSVNAETRYGIGNIRV